MAGAADSGRDARDAFLEEARGHVRYLAVDADPGTFLIATADRQMGRHLFLKRARPEFRVLDRAVRAIEFLLGGDAIEGRVFVDVGANIGTSSIAALVKHRFASAIACEPEEQMHRLLRANLALNGLDDRVQPLRLAVSNEAGRASLRVTEDRSATTTLLTHPPDVDEARLDIAARRLEDPGLELAEVVLEEVDVATLDDLATAGVIDPDRVGLLWIDAEGHDGHVLAGATRMTERGVPTVFEFHPEGLDAAGGRQLVHEVAESSYTHLVDVRRREPGEPRFRLRPVSELSALADRLLGSSTAVSHTDVLLLRLDETQAALGAELPERLAGARDRKAEPNSRRIPG
jgi:FkbM family methyltransferase